MTELGIAKAEYSHVWQREVDEHYVEPEWCSMRLFDVEPFTGSMQDPACGFGRVVRSALAHRLGCFGTDIVDRGGAIATGDFFLQTTKVANIVSNPPFKIFKPFAHHALELATHKVALIWLARCLAAARWLQDTPLKAVYFLTPRPSMPPGHVIAAGGKPGGGKQDFCFLVWEHGQIGPPVMRWLHRDK